VPSYETLKNKQTELIRKALDGSVFVADIGADPIASLTTFTAGSAGPPVVPDTIALTALPTDWDDLGWLTSEGVQFARDVSASDVTSWGSVTPTRTDITSDSTTLTVVAQETKLLTIGMATGADLSAVLADADSGEVSIAKPSRPTAKHYRVLSLAVDQGDGGEIYIARFLPRAKVSNYAEQTFGGGDDPVTWGVTLTGEEDSALGYSERWIFGGAGWKALVVEMGFAFAP
jgi:hypothetical protein